MANRESDLVRQASLVDAYRNYKNNLTSYAVSRLGDYMLCEDLVQETFTRTWSYLIRGGKVEIMEAFLHHVLRGLIVNAY